ncbi:ankyrin, partial [Wilcoxina mikolae CBS 423.85]
GETPLHLATEANRADVVQIFLEADADRKIADMQGRTPLHVACALRNFTIARMLLSHDGQRPAREGLVCDVNALDVNHISAMHLAAKRADITPVVLLLEYGASELIQDDKG